MNPAWKRRQRRAYARKVLEACTGPIATRKAFRVRLADLAAAGLTGVAAATLIIVWMSLYAAQVPNW